MEHYKYLYHINDKYDKMINDKYSLQGRISAISYVFCCILGKKSLWATVFLHGHSMEHVV